MSEIDQGGRFTVARKEGESGPYHALVTLSKSMCFEAGSSAEIAS